MYVGLAHFVCVCVCVCVLLFGAFSFQKKYYFWECENLSGYLLGSLH